MRTFYQVAALAAFIGASAILPAADLKPADVTVGKNLQTTAVIRLDDGAPPEGLDITVTSSDPKRLLLANGQDQEGAESIVVKVLPGFRISQEFWVQGFGDSGAVAYTASASGFAPAAGKVTLVPSSVVLLGPYAAPKFQTTTGASPSRLAVRTMYLDAKNNLQEQLLAGGKSVQVSVTSSEARVGSITEAVVTISGGYSTAFTEFKPAAVGSTTLAVSVPPGFAPPPAPAAVTAVVTQPGLAISDQVMLGHNLEIRGVLSLGEVAEDGLTVTLSSSDPSKLLLSASPTDVGSGTLDVQIPAGGVNGVYYLQALAGSGSVTYTARAPGFRSRTATVTLTPSGVLITPARHGPPDEAQLTPSENAPQRFVTAVSLGTSPLAVWTAQLDPVTKRGADVTIQPLRAGMSININIQNEKPGVGTIESQAVIEGGSEFAPLNFEPAATGTTVISVSTPPGFTTPSNATKVTAVVIPDEKVPTLPKTADKK
jgi:hypothetical protein